MPGLRRRNFKQEADARQTTDLEALRTETKAFSSATSERIDAVSTAQQQA